MIYITGHKGFVGSHLTKRLDDLGTLYKGIDLKEGKDASDPKTWKFLKTEDTVIHLAANLNPTDDKDIYLHRIVSNAVKKVGAYAVYISSAAIYNPTNLYAVQKLYGEVCFEESYHVTLRLFNVYGKGGHGIVDIIKNQEKIVVNGKGTQKRDFIHVEDVVNKIIYDIQYETIGTYNVGTGCATSVNQLLKWSGKKATYCNGDEGIHFSEARGLRVKTTHNLKEYLLKP